MRSSIVSVVVGLAAALAMVLACEDDPVETPPACACCVPHYGELAQRCDVLHNLEISYNRRHINKYSELLDDNFTFYFASGDTFHGKTPVEWGRQDEVEAHTHLFDPSYIDTDPSDGIQLRCQKIYMDLKWENGGAQWQEFEPVNAPGEKWYRAAVHYNFQFDIEPDTHVINNPGAKAEFVVRNAGTNDAPHWQLVQMRDLDDSVGPFLASSAEPSTWGQIKAIYR